MQTNLDPVLIKPEHQKSFRSIDGISDLEMGHIRQTNEQRGVYLRLVNYTDVIMRLSVEPVFLNTLDATTKAGKEQINSLVRTNYDGDSLSIIPVCECGFTHGERKKHRRCRLCNTLVVSAAEKPIESNVWMRAPLGVDTLMNPMAWTILNDAFTSSGLSILEWICIDTYIPPVSQLPVIERLKACGIGTTAAQRGFNWFHRNFDLVMDILFNQKFSKKTNKDYRAAVWKFYLQNRDLIFTPYLPIPNKIAFVTERTPVGIYADHGMASAQDAIQTITNIDEMDGGTTQRVKENRAIKAIIQLADYYDNHCRTVIGKKEGWFRKHVFGTRVPYGGRTVISSLACNHRYDELHIPWTYAIALFRVHLTNKLLRLKYSPNEINRKLIRAANTWDAEIADIFKQLIAETGKVGFPCAYHRNPTLARGSAQQFYITKVKDSIDDNTVSLSVLCLAAPNDLLFTNTRAVSYNTNVWNVVNSMRYFH